MICEIGEVWYTGFMDYFRTGRASLRGLRGEVEIVGDKSISHRAVMLAAIAEGETRIRGLLEGEDVIATIKAFRAMGVSIAKQAEAWHIKGVGLRGLKKPAGVLDMGNSGTSARLLMGILAGQDFETFMTGDVSLCGRPMRRVTAPLRAMGARFEYLEQPDRLPIKIIGKSKLKPLKAFKIPVASAQVKSAILLAALYADAVTTFAEATLTRDHSEIMMKEFARPLMQDFLTIRTENKETHYSLVPPQQELKSPNDMIIPADPSAAAFFIAAGLLVPKSELLLRNIGMNPTRVGFLETVKKMGANIDITNKRTANGEKVADLIVRHSSLKGIEILADIAPSMIDEYPILSVLAAGTEGGISMRGIGELRVKESDRIQAMQEGLQACGLAVESGDDWLKVQAHRLPVRGGASVKTYHDHRIAMSFIILGLIAENPIALDDISPIATSFPTFISRLEKLEVQFDK